MVEYTYKDIIIDPTSEEAKNAVGKICYFSNSPRNILSDIYCKSAVEGILTNMDDGYFEVDNEGYWDCIILKKEEPYEERAKRWIEENDLKIGDYVKVLRKAKERENGWENVWPSEMDDYIGKTLKVKDIRLNKGIIWLKCNGFDFDIPYFVLEKVEEPKPKYVPFESKWEFIESYMDNRSNHEYLDHQISCLGGIWLKDKDREGAYFMVTEIWNEGVVVSDIKMKTTKEGNDEYYTTNETTEWKELLRDYTFLDGTPCGKEVEE